jgi:hypothetical protein
MAIYVKDSAAERLDIPTSTQITRIMTLDLSRAEVIARERRSRFWRSGTEDV